MTRFTPSGSASHTSSFYTNNPAVGTAVVLEEGAILIAQISDRNGNDVATHSIADTNGGDWLEGHKFHNLPGEPLGRVNVSLWYRRVTAADIASDTTPLINWSGGASGSMRCTLTQLIPDAPFDPVLCTESLVAISGSGFDHWRWLPGVDTDSITGDDLLEFAFAAGRQDASGFPTVLTFTPQTYGHTFHAIPTAHAVLHVHAHMEFGQSGGIRSSAIDAFNGSNTEGILGLAVFRNGLAGGTTTNRFSASTSASVSTAARITLVTRASSTETSSVSTASPAVIAERSVSSTSTSVSSTERNSTTERAVTSETTSVSTSNRNTTKSRTVESTTTSTSTAVPSTVGVEQRAASSTTVSDSTSDRITSATRSLNSITQSEINVSRYLVSERTASSEAVSESSASATSSGVASRSSSSTSITVSSAVRNAVANRFSNSASITSSSASQGIVAPRKQVASRVTSAPRPVGDNWYQWALNLAEYIDRQANSNKAVLLPYKVGNESVAVDGIVMFDQELGEPVYSHNGEWHTFKGDP